MLAIELYDFVSANKLDYSVVDDDVILFIENHLLDDWNKLLGRGITGEGGLVAIMKDGYFCFWMGEICDYFDIDPSFIFKMNQNDN